MSYFANPSDRVVESLRSLLNAMEGSAPDADSVLVISRTDREWTIESRANTPAGSAYAIHGHGATFDDAWADLEANS